MRDEDSYSPTTVILGRIERTQEPFTPDTDDAGDVAVINVAHVNAIKEKLRLKRSPHTGETYWDVLYKNSPRRILGYRVKEDAIDAAIANVLHGEKDVSYETLMERGAEYIAPTIMTELLTMNKRKFWAPSSVRNKTGGEVGF